MKARLIDVLTPMVAAHAEARRGVTDEVVAAFMAVRPLEWSVKAASGQ